MREFVFGLSNSCLSKDKVSKDRLFWLCKDNGFGLLELNLNHNHYDVGLFEKDWNKTRAMAERNNVELSLHSAHAMMAHLHPNMIIRDFSIGLLKTGIMQAAGVGAKFYIIHSVRENFDDAIPVFHDFMEFARGYDVEVLYENSGKGMNCEKETERMLDGLDIKFNLDIGHLWRGVRNGYVKSSVEDFISMFADKIVYSHLHDNCGKEDLHMPLGKGNMPIEKIMKKLLQTNVKYLVLEIHSSIEEMVKSKEFVEKILEKNSRQ